MKSTPLPRALQSSLAAQNEANKVTLGEPGTMFVQRRPSPPKVERETFSLPLAEHEMIDVLHRKLVQETGDIHVTRSQVIRAGLLALQKLSGPEFIALAQEVKRPKTGRKSSS